MAEGSSSYEVGQGYVQLTSSAKGLQKKVDRDLDSIQAEKAVQLDLDATKLRNEAAKVKAELARLSAEKANPSVDLDIRAAETKRAEITAKLDSLSGKTASPKVDAETAAAQQKLAAIDRTLTTLNAKRANLDVDADIAAAESKLSRINRQQSQLESKRVQLQVDADTAGATAALGSVGRAASALDGKNVKVDVDASSGSSAGLILSGVAAALGAVGAAAPAAAAGAALAAGAIGVLGQAAGAATLGFAGIGDALTATEAAEKQAASASAAAGSTREASAKGVQAAVGALGQAQTQADRAAITGAQQVQDARVALGKAVQDANRTAVQGAEQVADAERALGAARERADQTAVEGAGRVADARRALAEAQVSAAERTQAAERTLSQAQESARFAQEALTRARRDAAEANEDLQLSLSGIAISERRALLSQRKAQEALTAGRMSGATGDQLVELQLNVDEATQNLAEVRERMGDLRAEQAEFARTGIEGTQGVTAAHRSLLAAQEAVQGAQRGLTAAQVDGNRQVRDAEDGLRDARADAAQANRDAGRAVIDAQRDVTKAQRDAAQAQVDANAQVADAATALGRAQQQAGWAQQDAARAVADAQRALGDAMVDTGTKGGAAASGLAYALGKLTPAGRSFVDFMQNEWKPTWQRTSDSIAGTLLPRIETGMRSLLSLEPTVRTGLTETGRVLGDLAIRGGALAASPPFQASFAGIMASNNRSLQSFGDAGLSLFGAFTDLFAVAGPITEEFARLGAYSAQAFESWIIGKRQSGELAAGLRTAADTLYFLGGVIGDVTAGVWGLIEGFAPLGGVLLSVVGTAARFIGDLASWSPTLTSIVGGVGLAAVAMSKLGTAMAGASAAGAAGGIAGFAKTLQFALSPSALYASQAMSNFHLAARSAGASAAGSVYGLTGSAAAAGKTASAVTGAAAAAGKFASALPLVGLAITAAVVGYDALTTSTGEAAEALLKGGSAASSMRAELAENDATQEEYARKNGSWLAGVREWANGMLGAGTTTKQANAELEKQIGTMTPLAAAQARVTLAQNDYETALRESGPTSERTRLAQESLATATGRVSFEQENARRATMSATDALAEQQEKMLGSINARIGYDQAVRSTRDAQRELADALRQFGPASDQAAVATSRLEQSQTAQAAAAFKAAEEEAKRTGATNGTVLATDAMSRSIGEMVRQSGEQLTPALQTMVQGLDAAGLSAAGAQVKVDDAGRAVATFTGPDGTVRTVQLDANTSPVAISLANAKRLIDSTRGTVGVDADTGPGVATVGAFKFKTDATTGVVTIDGNITPADQDRLGIKAKTDGTTGVMFIDGNPVPCDGRLNGARFRVDKTTGVMTIDGDPNPAIGQGQRAADSAAGQRPVIPLGMDTRPADRASEGFFGRLWNNIKGIPGDLFGFFTGSGHNLIGYAGGGLVQGFATGGTVAAGRGLRGYASGAAGSSNIARSDTVPAMLTPGEFVVKKRAVNAIGVPMLDALNQSKRGRGRGFASGGVVGYATGGKVGAWNAPGTVYEDGSVRGGSRAMDSPDDFASLPMDPALVAQMTAATARLTAEITAQANTVTTTLVPARLAETAAMAAQANTVAAVVVPATAAQTQATTLQDLANRLLATTNTGLLAPALSAVANTQNGLNTPASLLLTGANQTLLTAGLMPVVNQLAGVMFPTLGQYQFQTGTLSVLANQALNRAQVATQFETGRTATNTAVNSQNMAISTSSMSTIGQQQHANLRNAQALTRMSTDQSAENTARQSQNMATSTYNMSRLSQDYLGALRGGLTQTQTASTQTADWYGGQMSRIRAMTADPIRWALQFPFNRGIIAAWNSLDAQFALGKRVGDVPIPFAQGGIHEDHRATITRPGGPTRMWSEPETGGEAYIPMGQSKRPRSERILGTVASRFGYSLAPENYADGGLAFADGGLWRRLGGVAQQLMPGTRVSSGYRPGDPGYHGKGKAVDLVGGPGLMAINQTLAKRYPNATQLIYTPGTNLFRGRPHTYNAATRADHFDHVHFALENEAMLNGAPGNYAGDAGGGAAFDPTPAINAAFADTYKMIGEMPGRFGPGMASSVAGGVARKGADAVKGKATADLMAKFAEAAMGATSNEAPGIVKIISDVARGRFGGLAHAAADIGVSTGLVESNLRNLPGGDRDSLGVFQQRPSMGWGTPAQIMNVTYAAGKFFSRFPGNWASRDPGQVAQGVQRSAFPAKYGQRMGQARALVNQFGAFDKGGEAVGKGIMFKDIVQPERVLPPVETQSYNTLTELIGRGGVQLASTPDKVSTGRAPVTIHQHLPDGASSQKFANDVVFELRRHDFRGVHD